MRFNKHWWDRWCNWRRFHYHRHHKHFKDFFVYLEIDDMSGSFTLNNDGNTHTAVLTALNLDGSAAQNVTIAYSVDNTMALTIDPTSGVLTALASGSATVTGTGTRGSFTHSDTLAVTVVFDENLGDFTVSLAAS